MFICRTLNFYWKKKWLVFPPWGNPTVYIGYLKEGYIRVEYGQRLQSQRTFLHWWWESFTHNEGKAMVQNPFTWMLCLGTLNPKDTWTNLLIPTRTMLYPLSLYIYIYITFHTLVHCLIKLFYKTIHSH